MKIVSKRIRSRQLLASCALLALALTTALTPSLAQGQDPAQAAPAAPPTPSQEEMQKYFAALLQPGQQHELLKGLAGDWTTSIKMWGKPGSEPMTSTANTTNKMILDGRFLQTTSTGQMMGLKMESLSLMGFDGRSDKYTLVGFDTMGTYYVTAAGDYDAGAKTLVLGGTSEHPKFGFTESYQFKIKIVSADEYVISILFDQPDGSQFMMVEITHQRAK